MYKIEFLQKAFEELNVAYNYYEEKKQNLGREFYNEINHYLILISQNPFLFPVKFSEVFRFAFLKRFPYFIVYKISNNNKTIYVNSFFHTSRNPEEL